MVARAEALERAFGGAPHLVAYATKANSSATVIRALTGAGLGVDVVSGGELALARACGVRAEKIVMSGVGKRDDELDRALGERIFALQAESVEELSRIADRARALGVGARVTFRIKPGVEIDSHAHISTGHDAAKFGVALADLAAAWAVVDGRPELTAVGVSAHVGSNLADTAPYEATARIVCDVAKARLAGGHTLEYVNFGGGFGIDYDGRTDAPEPAVFVDAALTVLRDAGLAQLTLLMEPGRSLVAPFGVLLARIVQTKVSGERRWVVLDAGMNDLVRPALYQAHHRIELLSSPPADTEWRVVGPVCESSDDFGYHPLGDAPSGLVAIRDAGAYGFVMACEYNGRPLPAELFLRGGELVHTSPSQGVDSWVARRLEA